MGSAAVALGGRADISPAADLCTGVRENTVRDRLWIFTVCPGGDDEALPRPSRMTPLEGAIYLGVPNLLFIRCKGQPPIDDFHRWAIPFRPLKRVVWSLVGSGGKTGADEREAAFKLAAEFPNFVGFFLDDFFHTDGTGSLSLDELRDVRKRLVINGRRLDLWVVTYTFLLDLPIQKYLDLCDILCVAVWGSQHLKDLQHDLDRLDKLAPNHRKHLGCYLWDYANKQPMPMDRMKMQCELGLRLLREKRIVGMRFVANTVCDLDLPVVEWTRKWIAEVGDEPLG
jgi:hypothetical protein